MVTILTTMNATDTVTALARRDRAALAWHVIRAGETVSVHDNDNRKSAWDASEPGDTLARVRVADGERISFIHR